MKAEFCAVELWGLWPVAPSLHLNPVKNLANLARFFTGKGKVCGGTVPTPHKSAANNRHAGVNRFVIQLRLDAQKLVVLGGPVRTRQRTRLDLTAVHRHGQV